MQINRFIVRLPFSASVDGGVAGDVPGPPPGPEEIVTRIPYKADQDTHSGKYAVLGHKNLSKYFE
jgi:hypothetical protein